MNELNSLKRKLAVPGKEMSTRPIVERLLDIRRDAGSPHAAPGHIAWPKINYLIEQFRSISTLDTDDLDAKVLFSIQRSQASMTVEEISEDTRLHPTLVEETLSRLGISLPA